MPKFAVFIDVENVRLNPEIASNLVDYFSALGELVICRAVACQGQFAGLDKKLDDAGIEQIEYPRHSKGKNRADIHIVVDALELLWTRPEIDTFVIVSGDSDFVPLVRKLQFYKRKVIVVGGTRHCAQTAMNAGNEYLGIDCFTQTDKQAEALPKKCLARFSWAAKLLDDVNRQARTDGLGYRQARGHSHVRVNSALQILYPKFCAQEFGYPQKLGLIGLLRMLEQDGMCQIAADESTEYRIIFDQKLEAWQAAETQPVAYPSVLKKLARKARRRIRQNAIENRATANADLVEAST